MLKLVNLEWFLVYSTIVMIMYIIAYTCLHNVIAHCCYLGPTVFAHPFLSRNFG